MIKLHKIRIFLVAILVVISTGIVTANAEELVNSAKCTVSEGAVYWESSHMNGSGKHNTICKDNQYTNICHGKFSALVTRYSVIDKNGNIIKTDSIKEDILTTSNQKLMFLIFGADENGYNLGWINSDEVSFEDNKSDYTISEIPKGKEAEWFDSDKEKTVDQTAATLKKEVEKDSRIPRESYILADFSGSMSEFQSDVLEKLKETPGKKYVFAENVEEFNIEKERFSYDIGGGTDIANALNTVDINENSHIYIMSDLNNNCETKITINENFSGEITIIYYPNNYLNAMVFFKKLRQAYPNAVITGF